MHKMCPKKIAILKAYFKKKVRMPYDLDLMSNCTLSVWFVLLKIINTCLSLKNSVIGVNS